MENDNFELQLKRSLYRHDCPEPLTLGDFQLALLDDAPAAVVARHLTRCPHCRQELDQLAEFLEPSLVEKVTGKFRLLVARLAGALTQDGETGLVPAYALRGRGNVIQTYETPEHQIAVTFFEDVDRPGRYDLDGLIIGVKEPASFRADLWLEEDRVATAVIDPLGNFTFDGLSEETYELIMRGPSLEIHIAALAP